MTDLDALDMLHAAATAGELSITDGHYPSFKEIAGLPFKLSVVMWANDLTESDYYKRLASLELIVALHNQYLALAAEIRELRQAYEASRDTAIGQMKRANALFVENEALRARVSQLEKALTLITVVEQNCGGNTNEQEQVRSCIETARAALTAGEKPT